MINLIFSLLSFMFNFFVYVQRCWYKKQSLKKTGKISRTDTWLILKSNLLKYFNAPLHEKDYLTEACLYQEACFIDLK